jgi:hypothetical protein
MHDNIKMDITFIYSDSAEQIKFVPQFPVVCVIKRLEGLEGISPTAEQL